MSKKTPDTQFKRDHTQTEADDIQKAAAIDAGVQWQKKDSKDTNPYIITYSFTGAQNSYVERGEKGNPVIHYGPPTEQEREGFLAATKEYERVLNVKFVEFKPGVKTNVSITNENHAMIEVRGADLSKITTQLPGPGKHRSGILARADFPSVTGVAIELDPAKMQGSEAPGTANFSTQIHELGHAMGLKHPHDNQTNLNSRKVLASGDDSLNVSVMSYRDSTDDSLGGKAANSQDGSSPRTLMPLDIVALQKKYGANLDYNKENNPITLTGEQKVWTIWNGKQPATIDASSYKGPRGTLINLTPGVEPLLASHIGNEHFFIAPGTVVTKAIGTPEPDILVSNQKGGSTLEGRGGGDSYSLRGKDNHVIAEGGKNTYLLMAGSQSSVAGFQGNDTIKIAKTGEPAHVSAYRTGGDTVVKIEREGEETTSLRLKGYNGPAADITVVDTHKPPHKLEVRDLGELTPMQAQAMEAGQAARKVVAHDHAAQGQAKAQPALPKVRGDVTLQQGHN